ncbi:YihY/virulence factor BrkB family protein [Natrialbaceae archaeon A-arb3/5]
MVTEIARAVFAVARENRVTLVSAGLAFYMFNALIPLLLFVIIGITTFGWAEHVLDVTTPVLGFDGDSVLSMTDSVIGDGTGRVRAALIAAGILGWSSVTMFQSVNMAFSHVYGTQPENSRVRTGLNTLLILATVVLAVVLLILVHAVLSVVMVPVAATTVSVPLLILLLFAIFLPMFYQFPPPSVTVREVLPGAVFTAVSWVVCAVSFRIYVATSESVELYGIAGGVMLLLTWLYLGSLSLLVGVVLNAVLAGRVEADNRWAVDS